MGVNRGGGGTGRTWPPTTFQGGRHNINLGATVYIIYFAGVLFFANFASRVLVANLTTRENIYLRSGRMNATCVLLLDREFNHSRKCLEVPIREKLDSRNI